MRRLVSMAAERGIAVRLDPDETRKHSEVAQLDNVIADADIETDVEIAVALGGDGTILRALRRYANTSVPVFGVNFGEIGFLATVERDKAPEAFAHALAGEFETLTLPAIAMEHDGGAMWAINDVAIHRRPGERVAELAYAVGSEEVGRVRCDGLVVATPAGSTGYNLANGGPVLAWGVEGFVVSFIAPHSLTARALVVAPNDLLTVHNRSSGAVDVSLDGRPAGELAPGSTVKIGFLREAADLALLPGASFYRRLRETFGRLSSSH
jgi:NAD+ kinase